MSYVTIIWSVVGAGALLMALLHAAVWLQDWKARANLVFALLAAGVAAIVLCELGMLRSATAADWGAWVRWIHIPIFVVSCAMPLYVLVYLQAGRRWLANLFIALRIVVLVVNFSVAPNFNFARIDDIQQVRFLGEQVTVVGHTATGHWQWVATLSLLLLLVFLVDAGMTSWRRGTPTSRRRALVVGGANALFFIVGVVDSQLVIWGEVHAPILISPPFLVILLAITFEMSRDTLRASRLARELRESEERLEFAASAAGFGLWVWDANGNRLWATETARRMFGLNVGDPLEVEMLRPLVHPEDREPLRKLLRNSAAAGCAQEVQFRLCLPDGTTHWIAAHGCTEANERGELTLYRGVLRDVTEQLRARQENEALRRELAHAGRVSALGTLSSSLAHELGQPLGAMMLNADAAELLLKAPQADLGELRQIVSDIQRDNRRAAEVIERMRSLLQRRELDLVPVCANALLQDISALLRSDALTRHVTLEFDGERSAPAMRGDAVHLSQVLINLALNAMDAVAEQPAPSRRVSLRVRTNAPGWVEFTVLDSGTGIQPGLLDKIFEPFFTTKAGGMGIGLSVSRTIVEAHGGQLWAENGAEGGAVFHVLLPACSAE